jgi:hypothetical protein
VEVVVAGVAPLVFLFLLPEVVEGVEVEIIREVVHQQEQASLVLIQQCFL